ncbi:F-box domain-containing protein [Favolaschia claudopus]|uniref:F-box domain-containing protein n=1 Tax=Favolaschia claudopus TaxID=2862362 RepID=A0AAW0AVZ6_9AGAR
MPGSSTDGSRPELSDSESTNSDSSEKQRIHSSIPLAESVQSEPHSAAEIDAMIKWHYKQIRILKAKRNAIAPIRRLPNELMTRIITIFAVDSGLFDLKWTRIIFVCRHWHALALAAQPLWACIDLGLGAKFTTRFFAQIDRSGVAPLSIKISLYREYYSDYILDHSARIRELSVDGKANCVLGLMAKLPEKSLPILSSLSLGAPGSHDDVSDDVPRSLPEALWDGRLPSLRELHLECIPLPWSMVSGLTALSLTQCPNSFPPETFSGLLDMLRSCPGLRTLELALLCPYPEREQSYTVVDLPSLYRLQLRDPVTRCEGLLNHLRIPPQALIHLLPHGLHAGSDIRELLLPLRKHTRSPGAPTPLMFKIDRPNGYCTVSFLKTTKLPEPFDHDNLDITLSLNSHPSSEGTLRQMLTKVLKAVPCEGITHLDGRKGYDVGTATWRSIIPLLPALDEVYLQLNKGAVNFVSAMSLHLESIIETNLRPRHIRLLHIQLFRLEGGDTILADLLEALMQYYLDELQRRRGAGNEYGDEGFAGPEILEFEDRQYVLTGSHEEILKRVFALKMGDIVWNGKIYDPVERQKNIDRMRAEAKAILAKYDTEIQEEI